MFISSGLLEKTFQKEFTTLSLLDSRIYSYRKGILLISEVKVGVYLKEDKRNIQVIIGNCLI